MNPNSQNPNSQNGRTLRMNALAESMSSPKSQLEKWTNSLKPKLPNPNLQNGQTRWIPNFQILIYRMDKLAESQLAKSWNLGLDLGSASLSILRVGISASLSILRRGILAGSPILRVGIRCVGILRVCSFCGLEFYKLGFGELGFGLFWYSPKNIHRCMQFIFYTNRLYMGLLWPSRRGIRMGIWGLGLKPRLLQVTFDSRLPKTSNYSLP